MIRLLANEKGSSTSVEVTLVLPSLILMIVCTFDFIWISLHELGAQFVATQSVRDININLDTYRDATTGRPDTTRITNSIITRGRSFLLELDADEIEICSDIAVAPTFDRGNNLCPDTPTGPPGKKPGDVLSLVIVRIRPNVETIFLGTFLGVINQNFRPEGVAIGRNEPS